MTRITLLIGVLTFALPLAPVTAQDAEGTTAPEVTPTPIVGSASGQQEPAETAPSEQQPAQQQEQPAPETSGPVEAASGADTADPVLAQGLVYLSGDAVVWQVREVDLTESSTVTGNARVILQREGASVVRNDLTGKRARLEAGEAFFASAGDPYTTYPDSNAASRAWIFEVSNSNEVGEGAFYLSPNVSGYGEAVYDFEFSRHITSPGNPATIPAGDGPSMLMVLAGQVNVTDESGTASLTTRDGLIVNGEATAEATGSSAVIVSLRIGPQVSDASAAPPTAPQQPAAQDAADTGTDAAADTGESTGPEPSAEPAQPSGESGEFVTSIRVGAVESIGVTFYADGVLMYDGWLEPGEWTAHYEGSYFEVYTTSGENTIFENACGEEFFMGYEPADAYYELSAGPGSCAPVSD